VSVARKEEEIHSFNRYRGGQREKSQDIPPSSYYPPEKVTVVCAKDLHAKGKMIKTSTEKKKGGGVKREIDRML